MIKLTAYEEEHKGKSVCFTGHRPQSLGKVKLDDLRLELSLLRMGTIPFTAGWRWEPISSRVS